MLRDRHTILFNTEPLFHSKNEFQNMESVNLLKYLECPRGSRGNTGTTREPNTSDQREAEPNTLHRKQDKIKQEVETRAKTQEQKVTVSTQ